MKADLVVAAGYHIHDRRILGDVIDGFLPPLFRAAGFSSDQNVEVADRVAATPQGPGRGDLVNPRKLLDIGGELLAFDFGRVDQKSPADTAVVFDRLEQLGFVFLAHTRKLSNLPLACELLDSIHIT